MNAMKTDRDFITPDMKVGAMLDAYPELEATLISLSPTFEKLRNPVLRKTIARVASLRQVAQVGNISLQQLIGTLREAAGQQLNSDLMETKQTDNSQPGWFDEQKIQSTLDAREMIERGEHPMAQVLSETRSLAKGHIYELITAFVPAPLIEKVRNQGLDSFTLEKAVGEFHTYFIKQ